MIHIEGKVVDTAELEKLLNELEDIPYTSKYIKDALGEAGDYLINKGKGRLKQRMKSPNGVTGNLLRSFKKTVKRKNRGVLAGFRSGKGGGQHSWLLDRGTKVRKNRGRIKANKFWSDTKSQDTPRAMEKIVEGVGRAMNKLRNRN